LFIIITPCVKECTSKSRDSLTAIRFLTVNIAVIYPHVKFVGVNIARYFGNDYQDFCNNFPRAIIKGRAGLAMPSKSSPIHLLPPISSSVDLVVLPFLTFSNMVNRRNINRIARTVSPGRGIVTGAVLRPTIAATAASIAQSVAIDNASHLIAQTNLQNRRENTAKAYDPKKKEFLDFCDHRFAYLPLTNRHVVNEEKLFLFLFYQSYRSKKREHSTI
jgi:hypothetical protein